MVTIVKQNHKEVKRMKKLFVLAIAVLFVVSMASMASALITGSKHDLRGDPGGTAAGTGEICVVCHTPHTAMAGEPLLWNHEMSTATYTMYASGTIDGTIAGSPNGTSKLCLACHDGTVAIDNYGGTTGAGTLISTYSAAYEIDPDMSDTHPISIEWPAPGADAELIEADNIFVTLGNSGSIRANLDDVDGDGTGETMQCSTCHDVHDSETDAGATSLLRVNNAASAFCLTCHLK